MMTKSASSSDWESRRRLDPAGDVLRLRSFRRALVRTVPAVLVLVAVVTAAVEGTPRPLSVREAPAGMQAGSGKASEGAAGPCLRVLRTARVPGCIAEKFEQAAARFPPALRKTAESCCVVLASQEGAAPVVVPDGSDRIRVLLPVGVGSETLDVVVRGVVRCIAQIADRGGRYSADPRFLALHNWTRSSFDGGWRAADRALLRAWYGFERERVCAGNAPCTPANVFAAAAAEMFGPRGDASWSPAAGVHVCRALGVADPLGSPQVVHRLSGGRAFLFRYEDGFGFQRVLSLAEPGRLKRIVDRYDRIELGLAGAGPRPESMSGHVVLILRAGVERSAPGPPLPDLLVTPSARIVGPRSMRRGLFGGYPSYYQVSDADRELELYRLRDRDVLCYPFTDALGDDERRRLAAAVLLYAPRYQGDYRFLSENCSNLLARFLETALDPGRRRLDATRLDLRIPQRLLARLQSMGLVARTPGRRIPARTEWLQRRLDALEIPDNARKAVENWLAVRSRVARISAVDPQRAARRLHSLFARLDAVLAVCEPAARRTPRVRAYLRALVKDFCILIKRHTDDVYYGWVADCIRAEYAQLAACGLTEAGTRLSWMSDEAPRLLEGVEQEAFFQERARPFLRYLWERLQGRGRFPATSVAREALEKGEFSRIAADTLQRYAEFRTLRIPLGEEYFGVPFGALRDLELDLIRRAAAYEKAGLGNFRGEYAGAGMAAGISQNRHTGLHSIWLLGFRGGAVGRGEPGMNGVSTVGNVRR